MLADSRLLAPPNEAGGFIDVLAGSRTVLLIWLDPN
jgi:hypothetical protein